MVFTKEQSDKVKALINSIPTRVEKIISDNQDLQDITQEYLGEKMSDNIVEKIVKQEIEKALFEEMVGVMFGE
jgi:S-adenosylmethionine synthetase